MDNLSIYIPSRGRPTSVATWKSLPAEIKKITSIVVRPDEYRQYARTYPRKNIIVLDKHVEGLSPTRQWILENCDARFMIQLDDDFTSYNHKPDLKAWPLRVMNEKKVLSMFYKVYSALHRYPHVSIMDRVRAGTPGGRAWQENTLAMQFLAYDTHVLKKEKVRFDRMLLAQDKDMALQLLERGHQNLVAKVYSYNCRATGAKGGCDIYRNEKMRKEQCYEMDRLHPGLIKVVQKPYKHEGKVIQRYKVRVNWRRAFFASLTTGAGAV